MPHATLREQYHCLDCVGSGKFEDYALKRLEGEASGRIAITDMNGDVLPAGFIILVGP